MSERICTNQGGIYKPLQRNHKLAGGYTLPASAITSLDIEVDHSCVRLARPQSEPLGTSQGRIGVGGGHRRRGCGGGILLP